MAIDKKKRSDEISKQEVPGDMDSFNNRTVDNEAQIKEVAPKKKDVSESYMDYNGNSEQNAPANP